MKHNVNFFLFGMILAVLLSMVGLAVYFNNSYEQLTAKHSNAMKNLENLTRELNETIREVNQKNIELIEKERTLSDIIGDLNLSEQKASSLGEFYTQEKGVREVLEENLVETEKERDTWKLTYAQTKQDLDLWKKNYDIKVQELNVVNKRVTLLNSVVNEINGEISSSTGIDKMTTDMQALIATVESELDELDKTIGDVEDSSMRADLNEKAGDIADTLTNLKGKISKLRTSINVIKNSLGKA